MPDSWAWGSGLSFAGVAYVTAALLAVIYWMAASAKLRAPDRVAGEFEAMGIRSPETAARVLPFLEFGVAVLLVAVPWVGAAVSLAFLVGFSVVLVRVVRSGAVLTCACFGATSMQPVSWIDLVRNGLMIVASVVALGAERVSASAPDFVIAVGAFAIAYVGLRIERQRLSRKT